jgi:methylmalonyl-CoA/ethylmalonyl-CoA epimerase
VTHLRRLDHVAVLVRSTDDALEFYSGRLGLHVHSSEVIEEPHVRLTYLDAGNVFVQLVEPLDGDSALGMWLDEHGEGLHHLCFGVDDVAAAVGALSDPGAPIVLGNGRGRVSSFVTAASSHSVRIECTEFDRAADVDASPGFIRGDETVEPTVNQPTGSDGKDR